MSKFISRELVHPPIVDELVETFVVVDFLVNPNGELEEVEIINTAHPALVEEVRKLMDKMPRWSPAMHDGKAVYSAFSIAVNFS